MHRRLSCLLLLALALPFTLLAQPGQEKGGKDYAGELPRIPPRAPAESLRMIRVGEGFEVGLVAAEPLVRDPVAMEIDEDGRIFVVEYPEYNQYASKTFKDQGRIVLLTDSNGDGTYDRRSVYVDNLPGPSAVACWDGGILVGAAPDLLYCKDTDGDGRADVREVVYTGFGRDHAGEAMLNSFRWSLDNRFRISTGLAGGVIRRGDQKDAPGVQVRGQGLLLDPRTRSFELTSGGGQYGMSLDDWGRAFVCSNSEPVHMLMYDGRYLARNPYLQAPAAAVNIAPQGKYTKLLRISPVEPWRVLRTRLRKEGVVRGSDEGGQPSGFFTAATGILAYRGNAFPPEYRGNIFVGEVSGNLVYRARLEPNGVGLTAHRADPEAEFLASSDNWFRPAFLANAPDGCLYVVDMYRELIEGAAFLPPEILKHMDVGAGLQHGRIYRVAPKGFRRPPLPRLGKADSAQLVALLEHENGWHRDTASRLLYQRQDKTAIPLLRKLAGASASPLGRLHALHALAGVGALEERDVLPRLEDGDPRLVAQALRLAERLPPSPALLARMHQLVRSPEVGVRYQLAFSLGAFPGVEATGLLADLARRDGGDTWLRLAILSSAGGRTADLFRILALEDSFRATPAGKLMLSTLAQQIGAAGREPEVAAALQVLDGLSGAKDLAQLLLQSLVSKLPARLRAQVQKGKSADLLADLLRQARAGALSERAPEQERVAAVHTLGLGSFKDISGLLKDLLSLRQPLAVQAAALETLARFDEPEVPALVLAAWPTMSPRLRASATETILSRPAWIERFLDAVEKGSVARADLDPARTQLLLAHPDTRLRARAARVFSASAVSRRQDVFERYRKVLEQKGDVEKGRQVFRKQCIACHRLEGVGDSIGADLAAIRDRGLEAVLLNILDPNREVKPQFLSYYLVTDTGRTLTGMITAETASSLVLRKPDGKSETILRVNIEELRSTGLSFMPEGIEQQVSQDAMADLLAYLIAIR